MIELTDPSTEHQTAAELLIRRDLVDLRHEERLVGVIDRELLRDWFAGAAGGFAYDEVTWQRDADESVSLSIRGAVANCPIPKCAVNDLRANL